MLGLLTRVIDRWREDPAGDIARAEDGFSGVKRRFG